MHPQLALLIASVGLGFATGIEPESIVKHLINGASIPAMNLGGPLYGAFILIPVP